MVGTLRCVWKGRNTVGCVGKGIRWIRKDEITTTCDVHEIVVI